MIYNGALKDVTNFASTRYIEINSCNIQHSRGKAHTVIREAGRVDYHVLYVAKGECLCRYDHEERRMKKGDFVIYPPHMPQHYAFEEGTEVSTMWLHFSGVGVTELFEELGITCGIFHALCGADVEYPFRKMINFHALGTVGHRVTARGYLLNLLAALSAEGTEEKAAAYPDAVFRMMEYVNLNWQKKLTVEDVAKKANLSESRAAHLFKSTVGKSIHRYVSERKLSVSKDLLSSTDLSIAEISALVGFDDPLYFSRAFKSYVGVSPSDWRHGGQSPTDTKR